MSAKKYLISQFKRPRGILGRLAGWIMANRPSNRLRNAWTVDLLDLRPDDRVLEVGYGPGLALRLAAERVSDGRIVGIDHSEAMRDQARIRNRAAVAAGRVKLFVGSVAELSQPSDSELDGPFDKILGSTLPCSGTIPQRSSGR
jgi:SAM-dependent methyltransferase